MTLATTARSFARRVPLVAVVFAGALAALIGCQGARGDAFREKFKHYSREQNFDIALHDASGDARRRAVVRISESRYVTADDAFAVLDVVARTDPNSQAQCVAIRAFDKYGDARPVPTLLAILNPPEGPTKARPAERPVRWDATMVLAHFCQRGLLPPEHAPAALDALIALVLNDSSREVRLHAARALGTFHEVRALRALIVCLRHRDFGIAYEAEHSLVRLTGQSFRYDADAWTAWLAANPSPFGGASTPTTRSAGS